MIGILSSEIIPFISRIEVLFYLNLLDLVVIIDYVDIILGEDAVKVSNIVDLYVYFLLILLKCLALFQLVYILIVILLLSNVTYIRSIMARSV